MTIAKLIIKDEVNVKIEGLDLADKKRLVDKFKYEIPGARYLPAVRLGRWDGKVGFFSLGGTTYINLLTDILPFLDERGYDVEIDDVRDYSTVFEFDQVDESSFSHVLWPKGHPVEGQPIVLRDYQIDIINRFLENPQCIQEVATGAGKTLITAALSASVQSYGRSIVIVPSKDLVRQTEADYINMGLDVGVLFGDRKEYTCTHTICTWQSLNTLFKNSKNYEADVDITEFIEGVVCIMVDEAHSAKADALKTMLSSVFARIPMRWGLTGTIPKEDYAFQALNC
jgi:superfamily II DNA or RNA helicase